MFKPGIYQRGENFDFNELKDSLKDNKEAKDKLSTGKNYFYAGVIFMGVGAGMLVAADNAEKVFGAAAVGLIGFGLSRFGESYFLDMGDIHNKGFEKIRVPIDSSVGLGVMPVANSGKAAPGLVFTTSL